MAQHRTRRWAALFLSAALTLSQIAPVAYAQAPGTGLCEHHPQHTDECGYTEGSEGTPCNHEHTEDCYTLVTECVHEHGPECYPEENGEPAGTESVSGNTATPSEAEEAKPTECTHVCSEESECITEVLDCKHEHDEACGYTPATQGTPCTYVCEICNPQDSGETEEIEPEAECICTEPCTEDNINEDCPVCGAEDADLTACKGEPATPSNAIDSAVTDVQALIDALPTAEELERMPQDEQGTVYEQVQAAYDAYNALTDEQKEQITGAEVINDLFDVFNSMAALAADNVGFTYTNPSGQTVNTETAVLSLSDTSSSNNYTVTSGDGESITLSNNGTLILSGNITVSSSISCTILARLNITGGNISAEGNISSQYSISISGGHVTASGITMTGTSNSFTYQLEITGGVVDVGSITIQNDGTSNANSTFTVNGNSAVVFADEVTVTAGGTSSEDYQNGVVFEGTSGKVYGNVTMPDGVTIPDGYTLTIPNGASLTVPAGSTLTNEGTITVESGGTFTNGGTIENYGTISGNVGGNTPQTPANVSVSVAIGGSTVTSATLGSTVSITANISQASSNALTRAAANQVEFFVGTGNNRQPLGTVNVSGNTATLSNVSVTTDNGWALGENTITAEYGGGSGLLGNSGTATLTVTRAQLDAPTDLAWSTTPGQATWSAVTNASGYTVQLYKDGTAQGSPVTASGTSYGFANTITQAGSYTFTVTATGSGAYSDSSPSSQSAALYTVSFDTNGGTGTIPMQLVPNGGTATEPTTDPTRTGHRFDGWYSDSTFAEGSEWTFATSTVTAATTLYAKWTAIDYDITITVQGGTGNTASASVNSTTATSANMGDTVTLTATPAEDYHFVEWQVTSGGATISEQNTFTMPAGAVAITAVFEEHTFTGWTANGNDTHTGTCSCGETSTQACTYENGVCTVCGYVDVTTTDPANSTVKEGETATFTVTATGNGISYQWQISTDGSAWADIDRANSSSYTTQAATMDMDGYQYRCVVSNATGDSDTSSAATLTVNKTPSTIDPAFIGYFVEHYQQDPESGAYELYEREYFVDEINAEVTATPKTYTGYAYNSAAAGTVTSGTLTKIEDEADIVTLKLYYDPESYSVTLEAGDGTIDSGNVTEYTYGIGAALPTAEDMTYNGYVFQGWYESSDFSGEAVTAISATDTGNKTYYAKWTKLYTVTVTAGNGGTVSGGGTFEDGSTVTVTATANSGYRFVRWTENGQQVSDSESYSFTLTADRSLTAVFARNSGGGGGGTSYDYYTISATAGEGGSISPSGSISVREGRDQTYTITPDGGYRISDVRVDGVSVGAVSSYTFDNVQKRHTIEAIFAKENPDTGNPFTDVHPDDWFYNDVMFVYQNGLMAGTSDTTFSPNAPITRAQVAVIFYRMAGSPAVTGDSPFTDVENGPGTAWYYNAVLWAQQNGIVSGYGDGTFHPGTNITREQLAVIFYNYAKLKGYDVSAVNDLSSFTDAGDVSDWALPAMRWAVGSGIMGGYGDGILGPQGTATRAQVAAMLRRFIENNKLVPPAVLPGGDSGTTGTGSGGWTQQVTSPQTGDSSNVGLWFSLMLLSLSGIAALLITEKVRRHRMEDEEAPDPLAI